jgi:UDP-glucose:(heptosyl)LPS alpha-1,3-glucosyltransferase
MRGHYTAARGLNNPSMRIALAIERFSPARDGPSRTAEHLVRRLQARGHDVSILAGEAELDEAGGLHLDTPAPRPLAPPAVALWRFASWARRRLADQQWDATISLTTAVPAAIVMPLEGTARERFARAIAVHRGELRQKMALAATALSPWAIVRLRLEARTVQHPGVRKVLAISRYVADQFFHHYALSSRTVEAIAPIAHAMPLNPLDRQLARRTMRDALRLRHGQTAFLFIAADPAREGFNVLVEAMRRLVPQRGDVRLIVTGFLDGRRMRRIERQGLEQVIRWIGPTRQMDALYAASDAVVQPTPCAAASSAVLGALGHGVPAIGSLYDGASQWILSPTGRAKTPSPFESPQVRPMIGDPQPAGRVIASPADAQALAAAMLDLCDGAERERCAAATIGIERHLGLDRHCAELEATLNQFAIASADPLQP